MNARENRKVMERYKTENCSCIFSEKRNDDLSFAQQHEIVDINRKGALLRGGNFQKKKGFITLINKTNDEIVLEKMACSFFESDLRKDLVTHESHQVALFDKEMSAYSLSKLNKNARATPSNNSHLWSLMLSDSKEVKEEMYRIERCRSDIFLAIITAIFASVVMAGYLFVGKPASTGPLAVGSFATFIMFLIGAYTTLEKANNINLRRGFIALLNDFIYYGNMPVSYQGWSKMKYFFRDCGVLKSLKKCPIKNQNHKHYTTGGIHDPAENQINIVGCRTEGKDKAREINLAKKLMPGLSDSFMSLGSYIYTILYCISLIAFSYFIVHYVDIFIVSQVNQTDFKISPSDLVYFNISLWIGVVFSIALLMKLRKHLLTFLFCIGFMSLSAGRFTMLYISQKNYFFFGLILLALSGIVMGAVGGHLLKSLYDLRKGRSSPESYYFAWKKAVEYCYSLSDLKNQSIIENQDMIYEPDTWKRKFCLAIQKWFYDN